MWSSTFFYMIHEEAVIINVYFCFIMYICDEILVWRTKALLGRLQSTGEDIPIIFTLQFFDKIFCKWWNRLSWSCSSRCLQILESVEYFYRLCWCHLEEKKSNFNIFCRNKSIFCPKWLLYYRNLYGYNDVKVTTNKYWQSHKVCFNRVWLFKIFTN